MRVPAPYFDHTFKSVSAIANNENSPWRNVAKTMTIGAMGTQENADHLLVLMSWMQRLHRIEVAGLANDKAFSAEVMATMGKPLTAWDGCGSPPVDVALQHELAEMLYNIKPGTDDVGLLCLGDSAREVGKRLAEKCIENNAPFVVDFVDPVFRALLLRHASDDGVRALAADYIALTDRANRRIVARPGTPETEPPPVDRGKTALYTQGIHRMHERLSSGHLDYILTEIPTRRDAEIDGIEYKEYVKMYFEMNNQPWKWIGPAQDSLIAEFNVASTVRFTNSDGTDLIMWLRELGLGGRHFTFCNSLVAKNIPGSEIFSAPRLDSVEGVVVAKGRFQTGDGEIIENLRLEFEKGRLERFSAEVNEAAFAREISIDEGARYVGEIGIGTNPRLKRHVANGLLVEKIGGSFHIALGSPYSYTEYGGKPVHVNNGGKSGLHWDITTMLHGKNGRIELDGRAVMIDGKWLDEKYDVLNRGWDAVPEEQRPARWRTPAPKP